MSMDATPADDEGAEDREAKATEERQFRKWLKRRKKADLSAFDADYLSDEEKTAIASAMAHDASQEGGAAEDAPFPADGTWHDYP